MDDTYFAICDVLAARSSCVRAGYGAVATINNRIVAGGYNGTPSGTANICGGDVCLRDGVESGTRYELGCGHAEANLVAQADCSLVGATLYVSGEPCVMCARLIVQAGITTVKFKAGGPQAYGGATYLADAEIEVVESGRVLHLSVVSNDAAE